MEYVLICSTKSIPTIAYVEDLLEAPMDLFLTEDPDVTVWWPAHQQLPLYAVQRKQFGYAVNHPDILDYTRTLQLYNQPWSMWFGEDVNKRTILTLYGFVRLWNTIYPSFTLSGVVEVLELNDAVIKQEGEGLNIIIEQVSRMYRPIEQFSTEVMMQELLDMLRVHFSDFYAEYKFDRIVPTDKPDCSIFKDDVSWANRIIAQHHVHEPYREVGSFFDCIYLDGKLLTPTERQSVFSRGDVKYWWSITVYPKNF